jgi:hypothetical protein
MGILRSLDGSSLYVGHEQEAALVAYDLPSGALRGLTKLPELGLTRWGGPVYHILQHPRTRRLYFISGPGKNLFEADPDSLAILRSLALGDVVGTALDLDADAGKLYYQSGFHDTIHRVDLATFRPDRVYDGEIHARRIRLDRARNALYVLGHFSGTLFALDLGTGRRVFTVRVGGRPHGLALAGDALFTNSFAGVYRLDLARLWAGARR